MTLSQRALNKKPSPLFMAYVGRLVFRAALFLVVVYTFVTAPERLMLTEHFGPAHGFNVVDLLFLAMLGDLLTKFFPKANISMGSLKQFGSFHVPTAKVFRGGKEGFKTFVLNSLQTGKQTVIAAAEKSVSTITEVRDGTIDTAKSLLNDVVTAKLLRDVTFLRSLEYHQEDLTASELLQSEIRHDRAREIIPALLFWIILNVVIFVLLACFKAFSQKALVLWAAFYFLSDMICVVFWCPIQIFLMKNRCCTTCHIFNWDGIMAVTPLIPLTFTTPFAFILVALALVVLVRWEAAFQAFPERFDERTNLSLQCANCNDKLCYFRAPLTRITKNITSRD